MNHKTLIPLSVVFWLAGCATPEVVAVKQPGDDRMTCAELEDAMEDAEEFRRQASDDRGVTGKNAAAAVFFWPALFATYANTEEAIEAADRRYDHLMDIYDDKDCS